MTENELDLALLRDVNQQDKETTIERCIRHYNSPISALKDRIFVKDAIFAEIVGLASRIEKRKTCLKNKDTFNAK